MPASLRSAVIAAVYGALAGALAALTFWGMNAVNRLVWSLSDARWTIAVVIMSGGVLIALMRRVTEDADLNRLLAIAHDPLHLKKRNTLFLALSAIVAVGFGGAVGPEAGLVAVVSEASAVVAMLIARSTGEARLIGDTGAVATLSGLYGAPPGAAVYAAEPTAPAGSEDHQSGTPLALKFLGAVTGLGGFLLVAHWLMPGSELRLPLPEHVAPGDGSDLLWAIVPAVLGACTGAMLRWSRPGIARVLGRLRNPAMQTLAGSAVFALLAAAVPLLRFSGHHELIHALEHGLQQTPWPLLLGLGLLKAFALALCLASGWRGGEIFPLLFAGAAAGLVALAWLPATPVTVALVAGMTAAATLGMGKPAAVLLIMLLFVGTSAPGALCVGVLIGYGMSFGFQRRVPSH